MDELQASLAAQTQEQELLYFWALGDLHYYDHPAWQAIHGPRMKQMFQDLRQLWQQEGRPAFCVSPGDIIERAEPAHYQLARQELSLYLGDIPFYPGLGNHELFGCGQESEAELMEDFAAFWGQPPRYYVVEGKVLCIMLDVTGYSEPVLAGETLAFLETALTKYPQHTAILFAHCPLYDTVQDRDPVRNLDYDSRESFFFLENSADVRALLARYPNVSLYLSGHTHSGWQAPGLVVTEQIGGHPLTFVNTSSPWYTGRGKGVEWRDEKRTAYYRADEPDMLISLAVYIQRKQIRLRFRDHRAGQWLAEWVVPAFHHP